MVSAHSSKLVRTPILPRVLTVPVCFSENPSQDGKEARKRLPVVILLGWGGCRDKNLAKYSAIYHKRVSVVCRCLPRLWASATLGRFVGNWRPGCFTFGLEQRSSTCVVALEPCQRPVGRQWTPGTLAGLYHALMWLLQSPDLLLPPRP